MLSFANSSSFSNFFSNSDNLFHTEINSTIKDQFLTRYCNDVSNFVSKFVLESPFAIINCASKSSISIKEIIKIAKKENQYEDKDFKNLPIQNYQISTKLLNDFFQTKDSIFYIEEFFRYFKNQI